MTRQQKAESLKRRYGRHGAPESKMCIRDRVMEPSLAYVSYEFHLLEDENLPRTICRDVPGEFRVSQLIHKYFKYKDPDGRRLVIRNNEDEIYRLMTEGMDEFRSMGDVYVSENLRQWEAVSYTHLSYFLRLKYMKRLRRCVKKERKGNPDEMPLL